jgi:hypothetical protein
MQILADRLRVLLGLVPAVNSTCYSMLCPNTLNLLRVTPVVARPTDIAQVNRAFDSK